MCNAWNHSVHCSCGWGGVGHLGKRPAGDGVFSRLVRIEHKLESYVNPSASCPVCGAPVFFYQSEQGGRVFFDELGPPWPKHPCTDQRATVGAHPARSSRAKRVEPFRWQADGWNPWLISAVVSFTPDLVRISGYVSGKDLTLYVAKRQLGSGRDPREVIEQSYVHTQMRSGGTYVLALLGPSLRPMNLMGHLSSVDAMNSLKSNRANQERQRGAIAQGRQFRRART
jgi:hypothetical protein